MHGKTVTVIEILHVSSDLSCVNINNATIFGLQPLCYLCRKEKEDRYNATSKAGCTCNSVIDVTHLLAHRRHMCYCRLF